MAEMRPRPKHKLLGQLLRDHNLINHKQLEHALEVQRKEPDKLLGRVMIGLGYVTEKDILNILGAQVGKEIIDLSQMFISPEVIGRLSASLAKVYRSVPIDYDKITDTLTIAIADPLNVGAVDDLAFMLNCKVKGVLAEVETIDEAIEKYYGEAGESLKEMVEGMGAGAEAAAPTLEVEAEEGDLIDKSQLEEIANQPPVVKLVNLVLVQAVKDRASDVHFEPFENEFKIRYRVDGVLYEMAPPPKDLGLAITSRVKVMSKLNIAEHRLPQDGRLVIKVGKHDVDLRVSTLPTVFGESVVMRVLDKSVVSLSLDEIGMGPEDKDKIIQLIQKPNGIILATGPTGCGKTTTLYSCIKLINKIEYKIITVEDPVEYDILGIIQVQINEKIGLAFARCLRHIVRQDPDIIMVGEIRDVETAQISIQASLTGHLVFSTLHTNDAAGTITRMIDMGVEPFLITSTLEAIVAQRLVRTICKDCKTEYQPDGDILGQLELTPEDVRDKKFYYGKGCKKCNNTGYKGRTGIFELLVMDDSIRPLILERSQTGVVKRKAQEGGMKTLREDGLVKIYEGLTTIEEVVRETEGYEE